MLIHCGSNCEGSKKIGYSVNLTVDIMAELSVFSFIDKNKVVIEVYGCDVLVEVGRHVVTPCNLLVV